MDIDILKEPPSKAELEGKFQTLRERLTVLRLIVGLCLVTGMYLLFNLPVSIGEQVSTQDGNLIMCVASFLVVGVLSPFIIIYDSEEQSLQYATYDDCIHIKKYLADPDIKTYRDKVVEQPRKFVLEEVAAMKEYYEGKEKREACRTVYGVTEGGA